jgi:hypothetical protein
VQITIDTASRSEAETLAAVLPGTPQAGSIRGYGFIRFRCANRREFEAVKEKVDEAVQELELAWVRVRHGDEEWFFRARQARAS